jgi:hypothetical protein
VIVHHGVVVHIGAPPAASVVARELTRGAVVLTRPGNAARTAQAVRAETRPRKGER